MSGEQCKPGDITGFPLLINQNLFTEWPGVEPSTVDAMLKQITIPSEYSVNWAPPAKNTNIKINSSNNLLQIEGLDVFASGTTLTYGDASYVCEPLISIVQNQHIFFCKDTTALHSAILSFRISNKSTNPSSPDIILFCRPLSYDIKNKSTPKMWEDIDAACSRTSLTGNTTVDLSTLYGYNNSSLLPLITYQTCIPSKVITPGKTPPSFIGSLRIRVNLIIPTLYIKISERASQILSTRSSRYTLLANPVNLFSNIPGNSILQLKEGSNFPQFEELNYLTLNLSSALLPSFTDVINAIEIHVDPSQVGLSLDDLSIAKPPTSKSGKKAYKCYTVDPKKDIVNGQIMVDPTTGENLSEAQAQPGSELSNALSIPSANIETGNIETGIMPGDVENVLSITITVFGSIGLFGYLLFILLKGRDVFNTGNHTIPGAYNDVLYHIVIFLVIFATLILFGLYLGKNI